MKKKYQINFEQSFRQMELIRKYYNVDEENKTIDVTLKYEKASDILITNFTNLNHPLFNNEVFEKISNIIDNAPSGFKVNINFQILDFENYTPKELIESFNDTLELSQYSARKARQRKELTSAILILAGVILLFFNVVGQANHWFGDEIKNDIIVEIIDIAAWVFIWEAVYMLFLEHSEQLKLALKIRHFVNNIAIYQNDLKNALVNEPSSSIFTKWENEDKTKRIGKHLFLISSFAFIFLAFYNLYFIYTLLIGDYAINVKIFTTIFLVVSIIIELLAGIGGIFKYLNKPSSLSKFVGIYATIQTIIVIISLILLFISANASQIISAISSFIFNIFYIIGYYIDKRNN